MEPGLMDRLRCILGHDVAAHDCVWGWTWDIRILGDLFVVIFRLRMAYGIFGVRCIYRGDSKLNGDILKT
jgi:hypothetical protein